MSQLLMRRKNLCELPPLTPPKELVIHTEDERSKESWERIIDNSFGSTHSYSMITEDPSYAPDRVFFVREHTQDDATACAFARGEFPGEGYVHMVGAHAWAQGIGAGYWAVLACLYRFREDGMDSAVLTTDDWRLPAIATYLKLGFEPVMADDGHEERWKKVRETLAAYKKPEKRIIPLWPKGKAPYVKESQGQGEPYLTPFEVAGSRGAVIVCPGGGYRNLAWYEGDPISRMFRAGGISAFTLTDRLLPAPLDAPLCDAQRAVRLLRSMGYEKVCVMGFSAGGHLSCISAVRWDRGDLRAEDPVERFSCRPDAFGSCYGAVELPAWAGESRPSFDGPSQVAEDTPPAFIWHTVSDETVPVTQPIHLIEALQAKGVSYEAHLYPTGVHGLGLAFGSSAQGWAEQMQKWLIQQGYGRKDA